MDEAIIDHLRARIGTMFRVELDVEPATLELDLTEITEMGPQTYSVLFAGPAEPVLHQATHTLRSRDDVEFTLFLVPLGPGDEAAMVYEAVFNWSQPS